MQVSAGRCVQVRQVVMSRTARQVWLLAAFSMLLVCLYTYSTVHPSEPYFKRSHSSSTGADSVVVIFANSQGDTGTNDTRGGRHVASLGTSTTSSPPQGDGAYEIHGVLIKEIPFSSEKRFDLNKPVFRRLNSTNSLPPGREEIPPGVLEMIAESQNSKSEPGPLRQTGPPKISGRSPVSPGKDPNAGSWKNRAESSGQATEKPSGGRVVPDWVASLFHPQDADRRSGDDSLKRADASETDRAGVMYSDLVNIDEPQRGVSDTGVDQKDTQSRVDVEIENSVDIDDLGDHVKRVQSEGGPVERDQRVTNFQPGTRHTAGKLAEERHDAAHPETPGHHVVQNIQNPYPNLDHRQDVQDMLDIDQLSQLLDPDDQSFTWDDLSDLQGPIHSEKPKESFQSSGGPTDSKAAVSQTGDLPARSRDPAKAAGPPPDLDMFSSTEHSLPLTLPVHKHLTGKMVSAVRPADKPEAEAASHKTAAVPAEHENKKVKKLLHLPLTDLALHLPEDLQLSASSDGHPPDVDGVDTHALSDKTKMETQLSDSFVEGSQKKPSDVIAQNIKSDLNLTVWKGVLKERKRLLRAKCLDDNPIFKQNIQDSRAIVDKKRNFLYCPVGESAPGFFHRVMFSLKHNNRSAREFPSPFDIPLQAALAEDFDTVSRFHRKGWEEFMSGSLRLVVVRDPFSRLFAAYVDRLLVPDTAYWKKWGIPAITRHRKYPSSKSLACGHDVTFAEFVKYVISTIHSDDDIVKPVNSVCAPCDLRYSVIGHVETLVSDIEYVLSLLKLSIGNFTAETFMSDVNDDIISESADKAFGFYNQLQSCISKYEMGKRLWRNLQIHGIISEELSFSFAPKKVEKMTPSEFVKIAKEARKFLPDSEKVRQQKIEALKTAYENVPAEDIMQLVKIYALDFEFFGYDRHPSFLS
ncbi:hypothetical protein ACOMHN_044896 [Nucella lapillus]